MAGLRVFSADVEALASAWRERVETDDDWKPTGNVGDQGGEAAGYFVTSGALNGYAKPSRIDRDPKPWGRAAHGGPWLRHRFAASSGGTSPLAWESTAGGSTSRSNIPLSIP
jgi:hypothetical protein